MYHLTTEFKKRYKPFLDMIEKKRVNISGEKLVAPVDFQDDAQMVRAGLRSPKLIINRNIFKKSIDEKMLLKKTKYKKDFGSKDTNHISKTKKRLTVHLHNEKGSNTFKTTYSFHCSEGEIQNIFDHTFFDPKLVTKAYFGNKKLQINQPK